MFSYISKNTAAPLAQLRGTPGCRGTPVAEHWYRANKEHCIKKEWPQRNTMKPGEKNIINDPMVDRKNIIFLPLHVKLGQIKQFAKGLVRSGECFEYICSTFQGLSCEKKKSRDV